MVVVAGTFSEPASTGARDAAVCCVVVLERDGSDDATVADAAAVPPFAIPVAVGVG